MRKALQIAGDLGLPTHYDDGGYYGYAEIGDGDELVGILGRLDVVSIEMIHTGISMKTRVSILILLLLVITGCVAPPAPGDSATPTVDPDIYNQVPTTTVYDPGTCTAVLTAPAPAFTSNTLGGQPSGEIPAGTYEVGVAADYGSSLWFGLNNVGTTNWIKSTSVSSLTGACVSDVQAQ